MMLCMSKAGACGKDGTAGRSTSTRLQLRNRTAACHDTITCPEHQSINGKPLWGHQETGCIAHDPCEPHVKQSGREHLVNGLSAELNISSADAEATPSGGRSLASTCIHIMSVACECNVAQPHQLWKAGAMQERADAVLTCAMVCCLLCMCMVMEKSLRPT